MNRTLFERQHRRSPVNCATRERGATAIVIAIVITALMAVAALAFDVSAMHLERRELQSGADAAALALADSCAKGSCGTASAMNATAKSLANANAPDNLARVVDIDLESNQVTVRVGTEQASGGPDNDVNTLDFTFARVFGVGGRDIRASATARWSAVGSAATIPLTFSHCEWLRETANGTRYYHLDASDQLSPTPTDPPSVIYFHDSANNTGSDDSDCAAQAGQDINHDGRLEGGFGWLQSVDCKATIVPPDWVAAKTGAGIPNDCDVTTFLNKPLLIAVFADEGSQINQTYGDCSIGPGGKCYLLAGFARFYLTGYRFPSKTSPQPPCNPPDSCIAGYFIDGLIPVGDVLGGGTQDFGPTVVELVK
jgi:Flp pilus assembly protein TadG